MFSDIPSYPVEEIDIEERNWEHLTKEFNNKNENQDSKETKSDSTNNE